MRKTYEVLRTSDIARVTHVRYNIHATDAAPLAEEGRYILAKQQHFIGLRVHSDSTFCLTETHRSVENRIVAAQELSAMHVEANSKFSHYEGSVERLTEGSGGSAGTAAYSQNFDMAWREAPPKNRPDL